MKKILIVGSASVALALAVTYLVFSFALWDFAWLQGGVETRILFLMFSALPFILFLFLFSEVYDEKERHKRSW